MTTRRGLSLDVIDVAGHEVGMERTVLRTRTTSVLVIGRPRPLQILGYRRISPGFWWLSNASALAFEHRECLGRDRWLQRREREREYAYVCIHMCVCLYIYVYVRDRERVGDRGEVSWTSMDIRYPYIPIGGGKGHGNRQRRWYLWTGGRARAREKEKSHWRYR